MNGGEGKDHPEEDVSEQEAGTLVRWILSL